MTFEQWWAENGNGPIEYSRRLWNAALESAAVEPWPYDFAVPRASLKVISQVLYEINLAARRAIRSLKTS